MTYLPKEYLKRYLELPTDDWLTTRQISKKVKVSTVSVVNRLNQFKILWRPGVGKQRYWSTADIHEKLTKLFPEETSVSTTTTTTAVANSAAALEALEDYTLTPRATTRLINHVQQLRVREKITMKQMAVAADVPRTTLWNWMSRRSVPRTAVVERFLRRWPLTGEDGTGDR